MFVPSSLRQQTDADRMAALGFCGRCPVVEPCRADGRAHNERGIWGGEDDQARFASLRQGPTRRRPPPPTPH
jgi:hypothetical protein